MTDAPTCKTCRNFIPGVGECGMCQIWRLALNYREASTRVQCPHWRSINNQLP